MRSFVRATTSGGLLTLLAACSPPSPTPPRAATALASPSSNSRAVTSASVAPTPASAPTAVDRAHARSIVEPLVSKVLDPAATGTKLEDAADEPRCEPGPCAWSLPLAATLGDFRGTVGTFYVDVKTGEPFYEPADGRMVSWKIDDYIAYAAGARRAVEAARKLKVVELFCSQLKKDGMRCTVDAPVRPTMPCPAKPELGDVCQWAVSIGQASADVGGSYQMASVLVDPTSFTVVGGTVVGCPPAAPQKFEREFRAFRSGAATCQ